MVRCCCDVIDTVLQAEAVEFGTNELWSVIADQRFRHAETSEQTSENADSGRGSDGFGPDDFHPL